MKLNKCTVKFSRVFMLFAIFAFFVANCVLLSACSEQHEEQTKYDVAIRVACSDGEIYEFPVGEDEIRIDITYDGLYRTYRVSQYKLKGYHYNGWLDIPSPTDNKFLTRCYQIGEGNTYEQLPSIGERGEYLVDIETDYGIRPLTDYVSWSLYVSIK